MRATAQHIPHTDYEHAALKTVERIHKNHITILAGTDANLHPGLPALVPFG